MLSSLAGYQWWFMAGRSWGRCVATSAVSPAPRSFYCEPGQEGKRLHAERLNWWAFFRAIAGNLIGSNLDEELPAVHPEEDQPENQEDGPALDQGFVGRPPKILKMFWPRWVFRLSR